MNPLPARSLRFLPACLAACLAACTAWSDVRGVATGVPQPAYELRGAKLATLQAEALRLCPDGYEIARSWQRYGQPSDTWWSRWANQATDSNGMGDRQAFLAVVCKDAAAAGTPVPARVPMPTSSPPPMPVPNAAPATAPAASAASAASAAH